MYHYIVQFVCTKGKIYQRITQDKSVWLTIFTSVFGVLFYLLVRKLMLARGEFH